MFTPLLAVPCSCHVSTLVAIWNPCNMCTRQTCLFLPQWCGFVTTLTSPATSNKGLAVLRSLVVPTYVLAHAIVPVSPPRNSGKCRLAALNFWVLGYCESLVILANTTLEETFPGGVYLPMFWKRFVTATTGCVMNFILRDIEGYWGWLLKELLLVFPHLSVGESAAALHQLNEFFFAIIYLVETCRLFMSRDSAWTSSRTWQIGR